MGNWNNRVPPDSMLGIKLEGNVFYHENPRDGMGDYTFTFHSFAKKSVSFSSIILAITSEDGAEDETILGPGEVATFAAYASPSGDDVETNQPVGQNPAPPRVINVSRNHLEKLKKGLFGILALL